MRANVAQLIAVKRVESEMLVWHNGLREIPGVAVGAAVEHLLVRVVPEEARERGV
jgi:hypothetical protein